MSSSRNWQAEFFEKLKLDLDSHASVEALVAERLELSLSEAMRLVRGGRELSYAESQMLLASTENGRRLEFGYSGVGYDLFSLRDYFGRLLKELESMERYGDRRLVYAARDLPVFWLFQFPELAAFKLYFWGRQVYGIESFRERPFIIEALDMNLLKLGHRIWWNYTKIPSIEIVRTDAFRSLIMQLAQAIREGWFRYESDLRKVLTALHSMIDHAQMQAAESRKFQPELYLPVKENYHLFVHESGILQNILHLRTHKRVKTYLLQAGLNMLQTEDEQFSMHTEAWLLSLRDRSQSLSEEGSLGARDQFFDQCHADVALLNDEL